MLCIPLTTRLADNRNHTLNISKSSPFAPVLSCPEYPLGWNATPATLPLNIAKITGIAPLNAGLHDQKLIQPVEP